MFSGIVEAIGHIQQIETVKKGRRFHIEAPFEFKADVKEGDSIAVNGACLSVVGWRKAVFLTDVSPETLEKTDFKTLIPGCLVNLERAMKLSDRLNGHLVTGHIDGVGRVHAIEPQEAFLKIMFELPTSLAMDVVPKGSIAIDGISLTVNDITANLVETMIIPETLKKTTLGKKTVGETVQIELDIIGKYVKKWAHYER